MVKDPIANFWRNSDCFITESDLNSAKYILLGEMRDALDDSTQIARSIDHHGSLQEITRYAEEEGFGNLAEVLRFRNGFKSSSIFGSWLKGFLPGERKLKMGIIASYMSSPVLSVESNSTVQEAARYMHARNIGSLLIKENEEFVGIVSERDLTRKIVGKGLNPEATKISAIMSAPILSVDGFQDVTEAKKFMVKNKVRHLAVTDKDKIVGLISIRDLVSFFHN